MAIDRAQIFSPTKTTQQTKSAATDNAARLIVAAETSAREKKTAMLKALRLQQEPAAVGEIAVQPKRTRKK